MAPLNDSLGMERPGQSHEVSGFLTALSDELVLAPDEVTASRHVAAAAARARALARGPRTMRWVATATALVTVLGTGGVALAGGLPDPIQTAVADVARVLPLPLDIPYPHASRLWSAQESVDHPEIDTWSRGTAIDALAAETQSGEKGGWIEARPAEYRTSRTVRSWDRDHTGHLWCLSDGEGRHAAEDLNSTCDNEFVAPPRFDQKVDEQIDNIDREDGRDDEEPRQGGESDGDGSGSVDHDDADNRGQDDSDRREERHDGSPDDFSSTERL